MTKKILIIDDDPLIQSTLQQALEIEGIEAQTAGDGSSGLELVRSSHPDLILLDHHMPGMTGIEFLQQLRSDGAHTDTEVIYLTSDTDIAHINEALALGVKTYLNKSDVQMEDIVKVLKTALK